MAALTWPLDMELGLHQYKTKISICRYKHIQSNFIDEGREHFKWATLVD